MVTFAGSGDAFGGGGRYQACIHLRGPGQPPVLLDCGATSLSALKASGLDPIAYTGDTAWTDNLTAAADLLIAEAYYYDKPVPYHLRYADLLTHHASLTSRRTVLTHMSADMLARAAQGHLAFETAHDGLVIHL